MCVSPVKMLVNFLTVVQLGRAQGCVANLPQLFPLPVEKELGSKEFMINNVIEIHWRNIFGPLGTLN